MTLTYLCYFQHAQISFHSGMFAILGDIVYWQGDLLPGASQWSPWQEIKFGHNSHVFEMNIPKEND